ncbi:hypothetical protein STSP_47890 [Streptomyces jeddahensis]|uniref:Uncharacterized protein n=1 Tax=Streptomyces jeddahensis TaxID=1716141 RepID=A0A177HMR1_9ACTN|nr:hypothetical protein STSP_47890 [Streptomyces jeddahensis]
MLDRRDQRDLLDEVFTLLRRRQALAVAQHPVEEPLHVPDVRGGVEPVGEEVVQHTLVRFGVDGLPSDEAEHVLLQPLVGDHRQGLLEGAHEPPLALGKQEMQHIEHVARQRFARNPVQREPRPVELHVPRLQDQMVVLVLTGSRRSGVLC